MAGKSIKIHYEITFKNGRKLAFPIELDSDTLGLKTAPRTNYPEWTNLTCHQCPNCPLNPETSPRCPIAANISEIIESFAHDASFEEVEVTIRAEARNYQRTISLHDALRSIFGIYMATSGCPVLDKLRPLVATHLPFATPHETAYRALSMYALAQAFIGQHGGQPDWKFEGLEKIYKEVEAVNKAFHQRLVSVGLADASLNAIGNLNCYAQFTQLLLGEVTLKTIEKLFSAYLAPSK